MNVVEHHGRETAYRTVEGPRAGRLHVHGSGGDHRVWAGQYGRGRGGVALDLSGHGRSEDVAEAAAGGDTPPAGTAAGGDTPTGEIAAGDVLDAYADDVVAVARATGARVLVGNSLGGAVVLRILLERDLDPDAVVLCGTGARLAVADDLLADLAGDFETAIGRLHASDALFHDAPDRLVERSKAALRDAGRAVVERDFRACDAFDVRGRLDDGPVPALAITGEFDRLTPPVLHEELAAELGGERALVDDAAHLSFLERPRAWNAAVDEFLDGVGDTPD